MVGGRDDARVGSQQLTATQPMESLLLEHAEQLCLCGTRSIAHLIEKQRASARLFEAPDALPIGSGKRSALVAEEFRLQQRLGQSSAVHLDNGPFGPRRGTVNQSGDQFLARPRLTGDQDRRTRRRYPLREIQGTSEGGAVAYDLLARFARGLLRAQLSHLVQQPPVIDPTRHSEFELIEIQRFLDKIKSPGSHGFDRCFDGSIGRHHQHARSGISFASGAKHRYPVATRQPQIGDNDVEGIGTRISDTFNRVRTTRDFLNVFPTFAKRNRDATPQRIVVFDDENAGRV